MSTTTDKLAALRAKVRGATTKKKKPKTQKVTTVAIKPDKEVEEAPEIAYVIKDKVFGEFPVKKSANAWWMDSIKVELMVNAFKYRASRLQASIAAGVSEAQVDYFVQVHPDFSGIIERCRQVSSLKAKQTMVQALDSDLTTVRWFLENTEAGEYGKKPPLVGIQINMQNNVADDRAAYTD